MPAHKSARAFRRHDKSSGEAVSSLDWRANRLVDVLAKHAAEVNAVPKSTSNFLGDAESLVKYRAAMLGCVTFAANNHEVVTQAADGSTRTTLQRDATQPPASARRTKASNRRKIRTQPAEPWLDTAATAAAPTLQRPQRRTSFAVKNPNTSKASNVLLQARALESIREKLAEAARVKHLQGDRSGQHRQLATELAATAQLQQPPGSTADATATASTSSFSEVGGGSQGADISRVGVSSTQQPRQRPVWGQPTARSTAATTAAMRRLLAGRRNV